jgi:hypothetical protein
MKIIIIHFIIIIITLLLVLLLFHCCVRPIFNSNFFRRYIVSDTEKASLNKLQTINSNFSGLAARTSSRIEALLWS